MFNKLLIKALKKRFSKFNLEQKQSVSELVNETIDDTKDKKLKSKKRRTKKMADEKVEEIKKTEEVKEEQPKAEEEKKEEVKAEEKTEEVKAEAKDEQPAPAEEQKEEPASPVVEEAEPVGNGVRVEDLVTKDELADRFAALEAKLDAVINENKSLKDKLSEKDTELNGMKDKYENNDFGNFAKQGMIKPDKSANSSFEEYSRQFM